jgi:MYXO-CTERM domain-containing protein
MGGVHDVTSHGGEQCWQLSQPSGSDNRRYLALGVDDTYAYDVDEPVTVAIRYYDGEDGHFSLQYDAQGPSGWSTDFKRVGEPVRFAGSGSWKTVTYRLEDAKLANRQNFRRDLRISPVVDGAKSSGPICISRVTVERSSTADTLASPATGETLKWPASLESSASTPDQSDRAGTGSGDGSATEGSTVTPSSAAGPGIVGGLWALLLAGLTRRRYR